jgi:hypothetical protein
MRITLNPSLLWSLDWLLTKVWVKVNVLKWFRLVKCLIVTGGFFRYQSLYRRLPWAVWCLALVVLVNVYTGTLTSMLTAPNYHILANSMEDVALNPTIRPKTFAKSFTAEVIKVNQHHVWINDVVTHFLCRTHLYKPLKRFSSGC